MHRDGKWKGTLADRACVYTEGHPSPGEAPCLAHQGSPQQAHRFREGCCEGGFWVRTTTPCHATISRHTTCRIWRYPGHTLTQYSLAPYERRVIELLRNSKDKRARKLAKKRLGTFGRGKRKVDEMTRVIAESKRAGH